MCGERGEPSSRRREDCDGGDDGILPSFLCMMTRCCSFFPSPFPFWRSRKKGPIQTFFSLLFASPILPISLSFPPLHPDWFQLLLLSVAAPSTPLSATSAKKPVIPSLRYPNLFPSFQVGNQKCFRRLSLFSSAESEEGWLSRRSC